MREALSIAQPDTVGAGGFAAALQVLTSSGLRQQQDETFATPLNGSFDSDQRKRDQQLSAAPQTAQTTCPAGATAGGAAAGAADVSR